MPYYAEWLLSFPRAPVGSISIQAWALACGAIILLGSDALGAVVALATGKVARDEQKGAQPMKMASGESEKSRTKSQSQEAKKDL